MLAGCITALIVQLSLRVHCTSAFCPCASPSDLYLMYFNPSFPGWLCRFFSTSRPRVISKEHTHGLCWIRRNRGYTCPVDKVNSLDTQRLFYPSNLSDFRATLKLNYSSEDQSSNVVPPPPGLPSTFIHKISKILVVDKQWTFYEQQSTLTQLGYNLINKEFYFSNKCKNVCLCKLKVVFWEVS